MVHEQSRRDGREEHPHQLIFTPPYESESQPIEKLWGKAKAYVARVHRIGRTPTEVRNDIVTGLYGGTDFSGVTREDCASYVQHAKGTATAWVGGTAALRAAYRAETKDERMGIDTFDSACRARYRTAQPLPAAPQLLDADVSEESSDSAAADADSD